MADPGLVLYPCPEGVSEELRRELLAQLSNEGILAKYTTRLAESRPLLSYTKLTIVMSTMYDLGKDEGMFRLGLAQRTLMKLVRLNMHSSGSYCVIIADASPEHEMVAEMLRAASYGQAIVLDARGSGGIGPQLQLAIAYAYQMEAQRVLKIDPEKYGLAEAGILGPIFESLARDEADIIGVGRSLDVPDAGLRSLPLYQQTTEQRMSDRLASLGLPEDGASGIWGLNRRGMLAWLNFDTAKPNHMWQILWQCQLIALAAGLRIGGFRLPFVHPIEMVLFENGHFERGAEAAAEVGAWWRRKRDDQEALLDQVEEFAAATLGIYPRPLPTRLRRYTV